MYNRIVGLIGVPAAALVISAASAISGHADTYPSRPIKIIVPFAAGTSTDITARRVGDGMAPLLGQPFVVEAKGGAVERLGPTSWQSLRRTGTRSFSAASVPMLQRQPLQGAVL
jgi:tripartite-type tricarboxylate transporter receptor subunit TctC